MKNNDNYLLEQKQCLRFKKGAPVSCCSPGFSSPAADSWGRAPPSASPAPPTAAAPPSSSAYLWLCCTSWWRFADFPPPVSAGIYSKFRTEESHKMQWGDCKTPWRNGWRGSCSHLRFVTSVCSSSWLRSKADFTSLTSSRDLFNSALSISSWLTLSDRYPWRLLAFWMQRSYSWKMFCSFTMLLESVRNNMASLTT